MMRIRSQAHGMPGLWPLGVLVLLCSSAQAQSTTVTAHGTVQALDDASINGYEVRFPCRRR